MRNPSLLSQFESILDSDPLIDEVGFIHPSQFVSLSTDGTIDGENAKFWCKDHKLGVSTDILLDLYKEAKEALMSAIEEFKRREINLSLLSSLSNDVEDDIMKHSKAVLLLSSDFFTAWNSRKLIVSKKQNMATFINELLLSALVLSYSPKSEQAWCHRRWVIKTIARKCSTLEEIVNKESQLVETIAERSKMNYRAWNHRCWLVSYMGKAQALIELNKTRNWAGQHVSDNSCFHYRTRLLLQILEFYRKQDESPDDNFNIHQIWKEELSWNEELIKLYIGREALWLHRRFLSFYWIIHVAVNDRDFFNHSDCKASIDANIGIFLDNELRFVCSCLTVPDNCFEDYQAQATNAATYILWLTKQLGLQETFLQGKLNVENLRTYLEKASPERSSLWGYLPGNANDKASPLDLHNGQLEIFF